MGLPERVIAAIVAGLALPISNRLCGGGASASIAEQHPDAGIKSKCLLMK